jgi:hypothetical protein
MSDYNHTAGEGNTGFKEGNPGRPKGSHNKLSLAAVDKMIDAGFDPVDQYMSLLKKAQEQGNLVIEERALSRLIQFRYSSLHHSMVSNADDSDLTVNVTRYEADGSGDRGEANAATTRLPDEPGDAEVDADLGVNVTRFAR